MSPGSVRDEERARRQSAADLDGRRDWWVILGVGLGTLALGWFGFFRYYALHGETHTFLHTLYVSLQLFTIESGAVAPPVPLALNIARFVAPVISAWAIVRTVLLILGDRVSAIRISRSSGHVVVCGLGRRGLQLAREFRESGRRVVAVEQEADNASIRASRGAGVPVVVGNAADSWVLKRAHAERAERVIAVCGDDGTNVDIAVLVYGLVRSRSPRIRGTVHCSVQVGDLRLATLLERHRILAEGDEEFEASIFNTYHSTARMLFRDHPLDYDPIRPDDPRTVHLVLVGLGQMGKSLALQAARTGCFANEKRIRITAIDRAAVLRERQFLDEYPAMSSLAKLEFVKGDAEDPAVLNRIREWADDREALTTVAVCIDDDSQALSCALDVLSRLETSRTQLLVRMSEDAGLATLLEGEHGNRGWPSQVHAFGMVRAACTCEAVLHEELDELARLIHSHYVATASAADRATNDPKYRSWERLDEAYRNSSRASADHIPVKLRAVGCRTGAAGEEGERVSTFTEATLGRDNVELMCRMEHARWCAEKRLAGWLYGEVDDPKRRRTRDLVEWEKLPDSARDKDLRVVEGIPRFLEAVGLHVFRVESGTDGETRSSSQPRGPHEPD